MANRIGPTFHAELIAAGCNDAVMVEDPVAGVLGFAPDLDPAYVQKVEAVLAAHDPTRQVPRSATAKQVRYALNDLGVRSAWNAAVMASDQPSQDYWTSSDPMYEANAKIAKWCKAAGITPKALFDQAATE